MGGVEPPKTPAGGGAIYATSSRAFRIREGFVVSPWRRVASPSNWMTAAVSLPDFITESMKVPPSP
jgi:hypothetical protein